MIGALMLVIDVPGDFPTFIDLDVRILVVFLI
jgi:hypothetical protein